MAENKTTANAEAAAELADVQVAAREIGGIDACYFELAAR